MTGAVWGQNLHSTRQKKIYLLFVSSPCAICQPLLLFGKKIIFSRFAFLNHLINCLISYFTNILLLLLRRVSIKKKKHKIDGCQKCHVPLPCQCKWTVSSAAFIIINSFWRCDPVWCDWIWSSLLLLVLKTLKIRQMLLQKTKVEANYWLFYWTLKNNKQVLKKVQKKTVLNRRRGRVGCLLHKSELLHDHTPSALFSDILPEIRWSWDMRKDQTLKVGWRISVCCVNVSVGLWPFIHTHHSLIIYTHCFSQSGSVRGPFDQADI